MDTRHCSIPKNVVAVMNVSSVLERGPPGARLPPAECSRYTIVILVKNGRLILVQSEDISTPDALLTMPYDEQTASIEAYESRISQRVSVVASLIDTIDFEKSHFVVLMSDASQTRFITQPLHDIPPLTAPLGWLPRVQESDLYACQWLHDRVHCIWNGRQVDFFLSFSLANRWRVQQMITITHLLERLKIDITYEPLAIVVRGAEILGLVMARVEGRLLEMRDRSLAYSTLAQLHEANIMFESQPFIDDFLIHKGKLCITSNVSWLVQYDPGDKERDRLEARAWQGMSKIFDELHQLDKSSVFDLNQYWYKPTLLNYVPSPEPLIFRNTYGFFLLVAKFEKYAARKKKKTYFSNSLLKSDTTSGSGKYRRTNPLSKSTYHPYSDGANNDTLLISSQPEIGRHTSDKHNRRTASSVVVRAVSVASDHTLADVDDDATVIGDDERWKSCE
ncbi:hypothetical protein C8J55DRAFT_509840 [Lentinula edodes]|uniref:Uncharacterized protein n=1 Tax=Lentinula lateritia TaxID=40482 RepID=A0A9W9AJ74_9AGAR|nr:hypothetical protein C8J55DRAFT_509840 [Lentinula edodes]